MVPKTPVSRRTFMEIAAALGSTGLFAPKTFAGLQEPTGAEYDYDSMAKLAKFFSDVGADLARATYDYNFHDF